MPTYLEHANITVPDIDAAIEFLMDIDPSFKVRKDEKPANSYRWAHVGSDDFYIALQEAHPGTKPEHPHTAYVNFGVNHLAWVVDDFKQVVQRLEMKGYRQGIEANPHPFRKRAYYFDTAGLEWEIVEYLSEDVAKKNLYETT